MLWIAGSIAFVLFGAVVMCILIIGRRADDRIELSKLIDHLSVFHHQPKTKSGSCWRDFKIRFLFPIFAREKVSRLRWIILGPKVL